MATIDTSTLYTLVEGTETVTYYQRLTPSTFDAGTAVPAAKRIVQEQSETPGVGYKVKRLPWHLWSANLSGITPKVNDVIQDGTGARWDIERITPQRFLKRFRCETVKENEVAIATSIDAALLALLQGASFAGVTSPANVVLLAVAQIAEGLVPAPPCCILTPAAQPEEVRQMTFEDDAGLDVVYPYQVTFALAADRTPTMPANLRDYRQTGRQTLGVTGTNPLGIGPGVWWVEPAVPGSFIDPSLFPQGWIISTLLLKIHSVEAR